MKRTGSVFNNRVSIKGEMIQIKRSDIDHSPIGFAKGKIIYDNHHQPVDYDIYYVNKAVSQLTGIVLKEEGRSLFTQVFPRINQSNLFWLNRSVKAALKDGRTELQLHSSTLDGWFRFTFEIHEDDIITCWTEDITANILLEQKLEQIQLYEHIFSSVQDPIALLDRDYTFTTVNKAYSQLYDSDQQGLIGKKICDFFKNDATFQTTIKPYIDECLEGKPVHYRMWREFPNKDLRYLDIRYYPYKNKAGTVTGFISQLRDYTREKILRNQLLQSQRDWEQTFESLNEILIIVNRDLEIENVNQAALNLFNVKKRDLLGLNSMDILQAYEFVLDRCPFEEAKKSSDHYMVNTHLREKDLYFSLTTYPIFSDSGELLSIVGIFTDITELRKAKIAVETEKKKKEMLFASIGHDLKTPLNGILGFTSMLENELNEPEHLEYVEIIKQSGQNLLKLVEDILLFSKSEAGKITLQEEMTATRQLFEESCSLISPMLKDKDVQLSIKWDETLPDQVMLDQLRMRQILNNLLSNAAKFTSEGQIILQAERILTPHGKEKMKISVEDTGIGIASEAINEIRCAFVQADNRISSRYGGCGLGLSISSNLLALMESQLNIESQIEKGSIFSFELPLKLRPSSGN